jgi:hypothetical protein
MPNLFIYFKDFKKITYRGFLFWSPTRAHWTRVSSNPVLVPIFSSVRGHKKLI